MFAEVIFIKCVFIDVNNMNRDKKRDLINC